MLRSPVEGSAEPSSGPSTATGAPTQQQRVTDLLLAWRQGDDRALAALIPRVYAELKMAAEQRLHRERRNHSLQATDLVHAAYLRLIELDRVEWRDRAHFFAVSSWIMRNLLVEHARRKARDKRGGGAIHLTLDELRDGQQRQAAEVGELDLALVDLARQDRELARLVELRFFGGLQNDEAAAALGVSVATVKRRWRHARAWLRRYLTAEGSR